MWKLAGRLLGRLLGSPTQAAGEMAGMDARDLRDIGIGAGEIDFVLAGGCRGQDAYRAQNVVGSSAAMESQAQSTARTVNARPATVSHHMQPQARTHRQQFAG